MQTKKMSLADLQQQLSRAEMKKIKAGSGYGNKCNVYCKSNNDCDTAGKPCPYCKDGGNAGGKICQGL